MCCPKVDAYYIKLLSVCCKHFMRCLKSWKSWHTTPNVILEMNTSSTMSLTVSVQFSSWLSLGFDVFFILQPILLCFPHHFFMVRERLLREYVSGEQCWEDEVEAGLHTDRIHVLNAWISFWLLTASLLHLMLLSLSPCHVNLSPEPQFALKVLVRDLVTRQPLPGASVGVYVNHTMRSSVQTGERGEVLLSVAYSPGTSLTLVGNMEGYVPSPLPWSTTKRPSEYHNFINLQRKLWHLPLYDKIF